MIGPLSRLLLFVYLLESGLLLLVVPWSAFWERNLFVERWPSIGTVFLNHFVRGAVSGIGLVCLGAALAELAALWRGYRLDVTQVPSVTTPAGSDPPSGPPARENPGPFPTDQFPVEPPRSADTKSV